MRDSDQSAVCHREEPARATWRSRGSPGLLRRGAPRNDTFKISILKSTGTLALLCVAVLAGSLSNTYGASGAQTYPNRPVRLIVPFAPGGADVPGRMLAQRLGEKMGQPFVIDNRP